MALGGGIASENSRQLSLSNPSENENDERSREASMK